MADRAAMTNQAHLLPHGRAVQDLAAYGEQILMAPALGPETRRAELAGLMGLFEPGNIIDIATASDTAHLRY
jgi:hypothetical protein